MSEVWRPVVGFEGAYEVSNLGRVRSITRSWLQLGRSGKPHEHTKQGRILRPGRMSGGHLSVALGRHNSHCVHELVLRAFLGPPPSDTEARHLDGDEANNRFDNLVWDTRGNNSRDKKWHKGCKNYKLRPSEISEIKRHSLPRNRPSARELPRRFIVSESTIYLIRQDAIHVDVGLDH